MKLLILNKNGFKSNFEPFFMERILIPIDFSKYKLI